MVMTRQATTMKMQLCQVDFFRLIDARHVEDKQI
jgi:hypothetical protein